MSGCWQIIGGSHVCAGGTPMPDSRVHRIVEDVARRAPARPAVECGGVIISYGELDALANGYAHALVDAGARPGAIVAVGMARSADLIGAVLGALHAGGGFPPPAT